MLAHARNAERPAAIRGPGVFAWSRCPVLSCYQGVLAVAAGRRLVEFVFVCGWCGTECVVWGEPVVSWWSQKYRVPDVVTCWWCGGDFTSPPPPWDPAD